MTIPLNKLPGYNDLFLDYIYDFDKVKSFYEYDYLKKEDYETKINDIRNNYPPKNRFSRDEFAEILKIQNKFFNSGEKTFNNIELLKQENTFAVVTGQQTGILTGNLYTVIKAINSVQLCEKLSGWFPDYNFIPVFWLEADDHDFLEVNKINIISKDNEIKNLKWFVKGVEQERYLSPVASIVFDETIEKFKEELKDSLQATDFSETLFDFINRSYRSGIDFVTAFAMFANYILRDMGIVFCNPTDREIKRLLIPVFVKELNSYPATCEIVIDTSAVIEHRYEPQVKPRAINLFCVYNNHRHLVEPCQENSFSLKYSRQKYEKNEFIDLLYSQPENFSGNVILRPICQDYLLPTIAYVGGPSEVAYFAQFKDVYRFFDMKMPVIYPRTSITLLEPKVQNFLEKFKIDFIDLFNVKDITSKFMNQINEVKVEDLFVKLNDEMNAIFYLFEKEISKIDKNLVNTFKNKNAKYFETLTFLQNKFIESQVKQNEIAMDKLYSVINNVYPEDTMQERYFNISYYINKYGIDLCNFLYEVLDITEFSHQAIELKFSRNDTLFGSEKLL